MEVSTHFYVGGWFIVTEYSIARNKRVRNRTIHSGNLLLLTCNTEGREKKKIYPQESKISQISRDLKTKQ